MAKFFEAVKKVVGLQINRAVLRQRMSGQPQVFQCISNWNVQRQTLTVSKWNSRKVYNE